MTNRQFYAYLTCAVVATAVLMFALRPWIETLWGQPAESATVDSLDLPTPAFSMTDHLGRPFGSDDLRGKVWIADFIFTRCKLACPAMTARMAGLQEALRDTGVMLVSMSVDPDHDTPQVLAEYARKFDADPERWRFIVGDDRAATWELVENGFRLPVEDDPDNVLMPIAHSTRFVLVDRNGHLVNFYSLSERGGFDALVRDAKQLDGP